MTRHQAPRAAGKRGGHPPAAGPLPRRAAAPEGLRAAAPDSPARVWTARRAAGSDGCAACKASAPRAAGKRGGQERGAALLMAMLSVALVATLAAGALWRQWRGVEVEAAERARAQSAWILNGALDWSRLILAGDLRESGLVDHLGEPWAVPLAEARLSTFLAAGEASTDTDREAFLSGQIIDLQSRLNVMNLVTGDGHAQSQALLRFARLFELLGLPAAELGALQRNLARAQAAMTGSAGGDAPLLPRRFEQLVWLGLPPATLAALRPYVTLLPTQGSEATRVNLNTASAQVICAAVPELDLAAAQRLVAARERGHFKDVGSALALVPLPGGGSADTSGVAVGTQFFEVRGRLRLDQLALEEISTVQRDPSTRQVRTLWRERRALGTPAAGG